MPASEPRPLAPSPFWLPIALGLAHGAIMVAAFPPVGLWFCILAAPAPLIVAALRWRQRPIRGALLTSLGILPFHLFEQQWVIKVSGLGYVPMAVILALLSGVFVWVLARIARDFLRLPMTLAVPLAWTAAEVFRGEVFFTGYPWFLLAHPVIDTSLLALPAALFGTYGVSFLLATIAGTAADLAMRRRVPAVAGLVGIAAVYGLSFFTIPAPGSGSLRIAVVQTNIPQDNKLEWTLDQRIRDFAEFVALTRSAAAGKPDVIVWPETMFPGKFLDPHAVAEEKSSGLYVKSEGRPTYDLFHDPLMALQHELAIPMVVGSIGVDAMRTPPDGGVPRPEGIHNSVFLVERGAVQPGRYDKLDLTPFGEVMPYIRHWPWLEHIMLNLGAQGMAFNLSPGTGPRVLRLARSDGTQVAIATPICFEATKPALCRSLRRAAGSTPCVMVNLTNDGWFSYFDAGRRQHLQVARWRALELNTTVIRAANTGISAVIDSRGRVLKAGVDDTPGQTQVAGVLSADVALSGPPTIYARTGDVLGWAAMAAAGLMLAATFLPRRSKEAA